MADQKILFKIKGQENPKASSRWEEFELNWHSGMNAISSFEEVCHEHSKWYSHGTYA